VKDEEQQLLEDVFKVPVSLGSINCGIPYIATGLIGTDRDVVAGSLTTGPEMFIIGQALDVVN
jgi:translation initiation factor 6